MMSIFSCVAGLKPCNVAVTEYVPTGRDGKRYTPVASVTAVTVWLVESCFAATETPGNAPPVLSLITPSIEPRVSWAKATAGTTANRQASTRGRNLFIRIIYSSSNYRADTRPVELGKPAQTGTMRVGPGINGPEYTPRLPGPGGFLKGPYESFRIVRVAWATGLLLMDMTSLSTQSPAAMGPRGIPPVATNRVAWAAPRTLPGAVAIAGPFSVWAISSRAESSAPDGRDP